MLTVGGFDSCGQDPATLGYSPHIRTDYSFGLQDYHDTVKAALAQKQVESRFLFSCYTFGVNFPTTPAERQPMMNQIIFDSDIAALEPSITQPNDHLPFKVLAPSRTTTIQDLLDQLAPSLAGITDPRISIVGHSYGGWTAINLADRLLAAGYRVTKLVTLDPISMRNCNPAIFLDGVEQGTALRGCAHAPEDLSPEIERVANQVDSWTNYWQDQARYLHSSSIDDALGNVDNVRMDYSHLDPDTFAAHALIASDATIVGPEGKRMVTAMAGD